MPSRTAKRRIAAAALAAATVVSIGGLSTSALFVDSAAVSGNVLSTGNVDINVNPATAVFNAPGMAPGDSVVAPLTVSNNGTAQLRYAMTSQTTEDTLASGLQFTVKVGVTSCTTAGFGSSGTVLYGPGILGSTSTAAILGSTAQGAQAGDRTLAASASEVLCLQVSLPTTASNTLASLTTTATFTFAAEQTANNP